jgi:HK97 family phage portal protein
MNTVFLAQGQELKSIPLNALPESAWKTIVGMMSGGDSADLLDLCERIPWLARAITLRCNALVGLPFALHEGDEGGTEVERAEWPFRLNLSRLLYQLYQDYIVYARAYCFIDKNLLGNIRQPGGELEPLRRWQPLTITPKYDNKLGLVQFIRRIEAQDLDPFTPDQIAYWFKPPLRTETGWGISDAQTALQAAGVLDSLSITLDKFWKNGAVNTTVVGWEGSEAQPTDEERLDNWFKNALTGIRNAFKVRVVGGKLSSVTLGYPMKDLASIELTGSKREDIATALGVPHSLLFSNAANYATAQQDSLNFYDHTINPDSTALEEVLNIKIFNALGYHFKFHPERLEIYQQLETSKAQNIGTLVDKGIWTIREGRVATNQPAEPAQGDPAYSTFTNEPRPVVRETVTPADGAPLIAAPPKSMGTDELSKWRRMAHKRFVEGSPAKALDFHSDTLLPSTIGAVRGALRHAKNTDDVARIFTHAAAFVSYP